MELPNNRAMLTTSANLANNAYTHAPRLHPNLILGSLQLLVWLFFHPSAWRNYVAQLDPTLPPNFAITDLTLPQWRNPQLRRLLLMGYGVLPGLAGLLAGLGLWLLDVSDQNVAIGVGVGIVLGIGSSAAGSIICGSAGSIVIGVAIGVVSSVVTGIGLGMGLDPQHPPTMREAVALTVTFGIVFGMGGSIIGSIASGVTHLQQIYSLPRQIGGAIIGGLISGIMLYLGGRNIANETTNIVIINLVVGFIIGLVIGWGRGRLAGLVMAAAFTLALYPAYAMPSRSMLTVVMFGALGVPVYILIERIAGPWPGALACALGGGTGWIASTLIASNLPLWPFLPLSVVSILVGLTAFLWLPVSLYPFMIFWNAWLGHFDKNQLDRRPSLLRYHSAFWDERQLLRLIGLDIHLLRVIEHNPVEGQAASEFLSASRQRWAVQTAQIELEARWLESCIEVEVIGSVHRSLSAGELTGPASALLRSFSRISQDVLAALRQESSYNQRLALSAVEDRLDSLIRELTRSSEPYALRFRPIAAEWRKIIADRVNLLAEVVETRQEIDNPYVIGLPLIEQQEIFVGRADISARIEQLLLDGRRPPLLLYGQRRMGKTSLLNNLGRLLPSTIIPLYVDLQGPASQAVDHTGFFYNLARGMIHSAQRQRNLTLPPLSREILAADPFTGFDEWLDHVEAILGKNTALLTLDEFEALDIPLAEGRFNETSVLGMFRHMIQHRSCFKLLLTGSHALDEFQRWASYLINVQIVYISYLSEAETRQLIERPIKNFPLRYEPEASQRVFSLTRGHPALTQLLCAEIVALKNEQDPSVRRYARLADVETALPRAMSHGNFFFADIERNQVNPAGVALLRFMASHGEDAIVSREVLARHVSPPADPDQTLALLKRRELIEAVDGGYRFQVEMIRRWFGWRFEF
ncbi:MAG: ATP-binding protein [Chloroflexi bacterium]|nr:ATP-binding protein [Chloroflexota bacterium]